jgi:hypothetical protein
MRLFLYIISSIMCVVVLCHSREGGNLAFEVVIQLHAFTVMACLYDLSRQNFYSKIITCPFKSFKTFVP